MHIFNMQGIRTPRVPVPSPFSVAKCLVGSQFSDRACIYPGQALRAYTTVFIVGQEVGVGFAHHFGMLARVGTISRSIRI